MTTIRAARIEDLRSIQLIYNDAIANTTAVYEYQPFSDDYMKKWFEDKHSNNHPVIIAELDGQVAGFSTYGTFRNRAAYNRTMEHSVYVHPQFQRQGIGRLLLQQIIKEAVAGNVHVLVGGIDAENKKSILLHESEGFRVAGTIHEAAWKFDRWLDLVFMEKKL
jgi:L-amino acid N-acyltransferase